MYLGFSLLFSYIGTHGIFPGQNISVTMLLPKAGRGWKIDIFISEPIDRAKDSIAW